MSRDRDLHDDSVVNSPDVAIDHKVLDELVELVKSPYKSIHRDGPMTVIEFENGQVLPLQGGGAQIINYTEPCCSFCGRSRSEVPALAAPPDKEEPAICSDCAVGYVELFAEHGVAIELNISKIAPKVAEAIAGLGSQHSHPEGDEK